jgi:hypothetical protein
LARSKDGWREAGTVVDASILIVDAIGLLTIVWLFQLVRRDRLYVGYGVIFVFVLAAGLALLTFPSVRRPLDWIGALALRAPALVALGLAFVTLMLIYVLSQVTQLSNRLTRLTQELAIRGASEPSNEPPGQRPGAHD